MSESRGHAPIRVLVVDDNEVNRYTVTRVLTKERFEVLQASTGREALELARQLPDVVVLDVRLPDIDGLEVCRRLKKDPVTSAIPVLHLSATYLRSEDRALGLESGADGYLNHPVDARELTAHVLALARVRRAERDKHEHLRREQQARAQAEEALRELQIAKSAADRANRAKDEFLAALSHELRTPLTPLLMTASELETDASLPPRVRASLSLIRRHAELEARLIDDLLDLTRIARGKLVLDTKVVDAHSIVRAAIEVCESDARMKEQVLSVDLAAAAHIVEADPVRLQQVFWNILKNAVKFTPDRGRISIRSWNQDGQVCVQVTDTGIGISTEVLPRIFGNFEQGNASITRQFGGLGLGLAISRAIMQLHGGQLTAASGGVGEGASFTVSLTTAAAGVSDAVPRPAADAESPVLLEGLRVLLVEDHETTRQIMQRVLRAWGCQVVSADTVAAALEAAKKPVDLVVSDLGLPDGSGLDLMRQLSARHGLRGICLSGYGMDEDIRRSREAGFVQHLTKPVSFEHLKAALSQWGASRAGGIIAE